MNKMVFTWAEDASGKMVHVDSVSQGLRCGCICPCCHERLQARHGEIRAHGFAHHSDNRGVNLKICYMVIMYKLAEQIIQQEKRIRIPSYYGIFKERELEFTEVVVDSRYDREDKQPDVIATTADGEKYLIEFTFAYKVQRKHKVDYEKLNCVEIDLSFQTLKTLHDFLIYSTEDRRWLNNQTYFESIEAEYSQHGKTVRIKDESECYNCDLINQCCGIRLKGQTTPIVIENSCNSYRICKVNEYDELKRQRAEERKNVEKRRLLFEQEQPEMCRRPLLQREENERQDRLKAEKAERSRKEQEEYEIIETSKITPESRTCFMCIRNLYWKSRNDEYAHCGSYANMRVPEKTSPDTAKTCSGFLAKD